MKDLIKYIFKSLPVAFTKNQLYDRLTIKIMKRHLDKDSNCIDVGVLDGEILDKFQKFAPEGQHFGFEPIPEKYENLEHKYRNNHNITMYNVALSNQDGATEFNYVTSNPSYSGIRKRSYDRSGEKDTSIKVNTKKLDSYLEELPQIGMIKIDVEGAEYWVIEGAKKLISRDKPLLVFEHGIGGADIYEITPAKMYDLLAELNYAVYLLQDRLKDQSPLSRDEFIRQFNESLNYYFVAVGK
ncbi:MAG: FkbM family methyltransferase [Bacteroidota bacterium]